MTKFLLAGSSLLIVEEIINGIQSFFFKICILIDGVVYNMINVCYQIFLLLSRVRIFDDNVFSGFLNRFYVLVGVLTLFFVAYSLLKVIANPDNMTKGNMAPGKLIMNIITSIALIALLPAIFNAAYKVQDVVIDSNIIGKIIFDNATDVDIDSDSDNVVKKGGRQIASTLWGAFFYTDDGVNEDNILSPDGKSLTLARDEFASGARGFNVFTEFSSNAALSEGEPGKIHYRFFLSAIAGAFALYVVFSFVFDLGIRAVKLAVLQIIAPLPILMRIIPGRDGAFKKWTSITIGTFVEVIVRIFVVYMIAFLAGRVSDIWSSLTSGLNVSGPVSAMAKAFILMGIIAFAKQAPKMISDILGIKAGDMKLGGIRDKLREGGGFVAGGAIGAGVTAGVRNGYNAGKNIAGAEGWKNKAKAIAKGVGSVAAGTASGAIRGGFGARNAKTYADVAAAAGKGAAGATAARDFRAEHPMFSKEVDPVTGKKKFLGGTTAAHARNFARGVSSWATGDTAESLKNSRSHIDAMSSAHKSVQDKYKSDIEKNGKNWIYAQPIKNADGEVIGHGPYKTMAQLKNEKELAEHAFKNFNASEFRTSFIEAFKKVNGGDIPSDALVEQAIANKKGSLAKRVDETSKIYDEAVKTVVANQERYERTGDIQFAAKVKADAIEVDYASGTIKFADGVASVDSHGNLSVAQSDRFAADRVAVKELTDAVKAQEKHLTSIQNTITASADYYAKELKNEMAKPADQQDLFKIKEMQNAINKIKELSNSVNDKDFYKNGGNPKDVTDGLEKILGSIDEKLFRMKEQAEKDKKDKK